MGIECFLRSSTFVISPSLIFRYDFILFSASPFPLDILTHIVEVLFRVLVLCVDRPYFIIHPIAALYKSDFLALIVSPLKTLYLSMLRGEPPLFNLSLTESVVFPYVHLLSEYGTIWNKCSVAVFSCKFHFNLHVLRRNLLCIIFLFPPVYVNMIVVSSFFDIFDFGIYFICANCFFLLGNLRTL